mgnify:CR=1 FL=1
MVALACGEFGEVEAAVLEVAGAQIKVHKHSVRQVAM